MKFVPPPDNLPVVGAPIIMPGALLIETLMPLAEHLPEQLPTIPSDGTAQPLAHEGRDAEVLADLYAFFLGLLRIERRRQKAQPKPGGNH